MSTRQITPEMDFVNCLCRHFMSTTLSNFAGYSIVEPDGPDVEQVNCGPSCNGYE